jgi:2-phospho-L-lactate guanylyltransferase
MSWTAVLPLKLGVDRKSRLASRLSPEERRLLSDQMAAIVMGCVEASASVDRMILLSPTVAPGSWEWRRDEGRGLNAELTALRSDLGGTSMLVVHGDLPLLAPDDLDALIAAANNGCALAPDRHGSGTNALALREGFPLAFAFGENSCDLHRASAGDGAGIVRRPGLMIDVDTPEDLDTAIAAGFRLSAPMGRN